MLALGGLAAVPCAAATYFGTLVSEVLFEPPLSAQWRQGHRALVDVSAGDSLDASSLGRSIQALFRTGRYSDIQVDATSTGEGVRLVFRTTPAWFVGNVRVEGVGRPPSAGQLVNATKLRLGEPFSEQALGEAENSVLSLLSEYGFREAGIMPILEHDVPNQQVHVTLAVRTGPRARIGALFVSGNRPILGEAEIRPIAGWKRGAPFRRDRLQRGITRLRQHFEAMGHWAATIRAQAAEYRPAANEVTLVARIEPGPRTFVRLEGARISQRRLHNRLSAIFRGSIDADLLEAGKASLLEHFQSRGYVEAGVSYEVATAASGDVTVLYRVDRGASRKLREVRVQGNRSFDLGTIRERMRLGAGGGGGRRFTSSTLEADLAAIRSLYRSNGFRDARVSGSVVLRPGGGGFDVGIDIDEGSPTLVASLETSGMAEFPADERRFQFAAAAGQPFSEASIATDRQRILWEFFDAGYQDVRFGWRAEPSGSPRRVALLYDVSHGRPLRTGRVALSGASRTRPDVLARNIELREGEPLSQAAMFATQRNLYDLGSFSKVDVALQNPDGAETDRTVLIQVEEARRWAFGFGGGAEIGQIGRNTAELTNPAGEAGFSPRMTVEVTRLNMLGKAHTLSFNTRLSLLQQRGLFTYQAPRWFDSDRWQLAITGLYDTFRNVNTFAGRRVEGALQLSQNLSRTTTVLYRYAYRRTSVDEQTLHIEPLLVPLVSQPVRVGSLSSTYISDRRDNPTDTAAGMYSTLNIALASKLVGSQPSFARVIAQNSTYHQLRPRLVFARSLQLGVAVPWGRYVTGGDQSPGFARRPDPRVPLAERYFGGGANSHRGFAYNQAGPRDAATGFPLGGGAQLLNSVELRFPLGGVDLSGVVFHDAGNVFSRPSRISLRSAQFVRPTATGTEYDFDYLVHAMGFGVRYRTPIGPVRLDLAYTPNPPRFLGFDGTRQQLLVGAGTFREQRSSSFQFHFSLGQTF